VDRQTRNAIFELLTTSLRSIARGDPLCLAFGPGVCETHWTLNIMKNELFEDFLTTGGGRNCERLVTNKYRTPQQLFEIVHAAVAEAIPHLDEGQRYETSDFFDEEKWCKSFFEGEQHAAGMCLAYLVRNGAVPLIERRTRSGAGTHQYMLPVVYKAGVGALPPLPSNLCATNAVRG
jgi:hypothetical protein